MYISGEAEKASLCKPLSILFCMPSSRQAGARSEDRVLFTCTSWLIDCPYGGNIRSKKPYLGSSSEANCKAVPHASSEVTLLVRLEELRFSIYNSKLATPPL